MMRLNYPRSLQKQCRKTDGNTSHTHTHTHTHTLTHTHTHTQIATMCQSVRSGHLELSMTPVNHYPAVLGYYILRARIFMCYGDLGY